MWRRGVCFPLGLAVGFDHQPRSFSHCGPESTGVVAIQVPVVAARLCQLQYAIERPVCSMSDFGVPVRGVLY